MQPFGDLDILLFVRIGWLNWIGHVNRVDINKRVVKFLKIILKEAD
jgi:hypothetical protein